MLRQNLEFVLETIESTSSVSEFLTQNSDAEFGSSIQNRNAVFLLFMCHTNFRIVVVASKSDTVSDRVIQPERSSKMPVQN
jgi:hypothetical protein